MISGGESARRGGSFWFSLVLVVGLSTFMRIALIIATPQPIAAHDAEQYLTLAANIVVGNGYSLWPTAPFDPDVYRSPGYPLFLAVFLLLGAGPIGIAAGQTILEFAAIARASFAIERRFGQTAAKVSFGLAAFCPFTAVWSVQFMSESLTITFLYFFVAAVLDYRGWRRDVAIGLILGGITLVRGGFLPAILFAVAAILFFSEGRIAKRIWSASICALAALALLLPYGLWNLARHDQFSVTPLSGMGRAIVGGVATMPHKPLIDASDDAWRTHLSIWRRGETRPSARELIDADKELGDAGKRAIRRDPSAFLYGAFRHGLSVWIGERYLFSVVNSDIPYNTLRVISLGFLFAGLAGLFRAKISRMERALLFAPALAMALVLPWLWIEMRYTSVVFGIFAIMAGALVRNRPARK